MTTDHIAATEACATQNEVMLVRLEQLLVSG
jgi:hypothetical protein